MPAMGGDIDQGAASVAQHLMHAMDRQPGAYTAEWDGAAGVRITVDPEQTFEPAGTVFLVSVVRAERCPAQSPERARCELLAGHKGTHRVEVTWL